MGGETKIGKTFINLNLARSVALGKPLFNHPKLKCTQGRVLLIDKELGENMLGKRAKIFLKDLTKEELEEMRTRIYYNSKDIKFNFNSKEGFTHIVSILEKFEPNLLILDPMGRMQHFAESTSEGVAKLGEMLDELLFKFKSTNMSILYTHHFRKHSIESDKKDSNYDPLDIQNFRGSSKWGDDVDSIICISKLQEYWEVKEERTWKWWKLGMRFTLRDDQGLEDLTLTVNKNADLKVLLDTSRQRDPVPISRSSVRL